MRDNGEKGYLEGMIVVVFKDHIGEDQAKELTSSFGLKARKWTELFRILTVEVPVGTERHWMEKFNAHESVKIASLNTIRHLSSGT